MVTASYRINLFPQTAEQSAVCFFSFSIFTPAEEESDLPEVGNRVFILTRDFFISNVTPAEEGDDLPEVGNRTLILPRALWSISINRICYYFQRRIMLLLTKQSMLFLKSLS